MALRFHIGSVQNDSIGMIEENKVLKNWYQSHGFAHIGIKKFVYLPFAVGLMEQLV